MRYITTGSNQHYTFNYQVSKKLYELYIQMSDESFLSNLHDILHFACFISYVKELNMEQTLGDEGIIHQLVHLLTVNDPMINLKEIRKDFETLLKLS